jgi:hypothetical protein
MWNSTFGQHLPFIILIDFCFLGQHFFWGPLEKKYYQNLGSQSAPSQKIVSLKILKLFENIPEYAKENKIKSKLILIYTVLNKK